MINNQMKKYSYSLLGSVNEYGEQDLDFTVVGEIEIAINLFTQNTTDRIVYSQAEYIGLTKSNEITDKYIIHFNDEKLKVLYINQFGRYKQVYLQRI